MVMTKGDWHERALVTLTLTDLGALPAVIERIEIRETKPAGVIRVFHVKTDDGRSFDVTESELSPRDGWQRGVNDLDALPRAE